MYKQKIDETRCENMLQPLPSFKLSLSLSFISLFLVTPLLLFHFLFCSFLSWSSSPPERNLIKTNPTNWARIVDYKYDNRCESTADSTHDAAADAASHFLETVYQQNDRTARHSSRLGSYTVQIKGRPWESRQRFSLLESHSPVCSSVRPSARSLASQLS